ncbi:MAG: NADH-quinone oxidoreductase subunit NuoE [Candidatus Omnitrophota bacterium]
MTTQEKENMNELKLFMERHKKLAHSESYLIAILHKAQELYGYLRKDIMDEIAIYMSIPTAHIWGVATFYHYFNLAPVGAHIVSVCMGTACYVKGSGEILEALEKELGIKIGQTTDDGLFTLQQARCLGACGLAPVIMINDIIYGELNAEKAVALIKECRRNYKEGRDEMHK